MTAESLHARLGEPGLVIVDCRWKLGDPTAGEQLWRASRIPGAAFLDVDADLSASPGNGGRHPLPCRAGFEASARRAGIRADSTVVAYDAGGEGGAARLWWLLRHFGHEQMAILDGGFGAWPFEVDDGPPSYPQLGNFTALERNDDVAWINEVREGGGRLIDARARERYRGDVEPIDAIAGHIPGAENVPFATLLRDGRFVPPGELQDALGRTRDAIAYCGSGISACVLIAAAAAADQPLPRLYPGSWSEWSQAMTAPRGDR